MAKHKKRWHGKMGGNHATIIEAAWRFMPAIVRSPFVTRVSPGFITAGKNATGRAAVKIKEDKGSILLSVRGPSAHQEIRIFANDYAAAKLAIAAAAEKEGFHVSYAEAQP